MRSINGTADRIVIASVRFKMIIRPGLNARTVNLRQNGMSLLSGLHGGLGDFAFLFLLGDGLDDADGHRLPHVAHSEATQGWVLGEGLHAHGLGRSHFDDGSVSVLDGFRESFELFAGTTIASDQDKIKMKGLT